MTSKRTDRGYEILNFTVDIGGGKKDRIIVHENDDPPEVARDFVIKHNLSAKLESALSKNIYELLRDINKDQLLLVILFHQSQKLVLEPKKLWRKTLYERIET